MLRLHSFLQNMISCFRSRAVPKKCYRNAVILTAGTLVVAVVSLGAKDFGGSGKNVVFAANAETASTEHGPHESPEEPVSIMLEETEPETTAEIQMEPSEEIGQETREMIGQKVVQDVYDSMPKEPVVDYSDEDYEALLRIVEAEAGICDYKGKVLVANVVLNRVRNESFPDTIKEVIYQRSGSTYQFSPVKSGSIRRVTVSEETYEAVEAALYGEDYSEGALFFSARSKSNPNSMKWFDRKLKFLFEHDGHEFFTTK
jgi:N-acetylmuramoyl-L-alanine amidase